MAIHYRTFTILGAGIALCMVSSLAGTTTTKKESTTYSKDIRKLIATRCASCHQPNGPAPFSLLTYEEVKKRAELIRYVAILKIMPPMDAHSDVGSLVNHQPLTDSELVDFQFWVKAGMPEGEPSTPIKTEAPFVLKGDVLESKAITVKSEGAPYTEVLEFDEPLKDRPLAAFNVQPKQPKAVRHIVLARIDKDMNASEVFKPLEWQSEYLVGAWAAGYSAWTNNLPGPKTNRTKLVALVTYMPTGKTENGALKVGVSYQEEKAESKPSTIVWKKLGKSDFEIPARDQLTTLTDELVLDSDYHLIAMVPQLRRYAREVTVEAIPESGENRMLLNIYTWDSQWPGAYNFSRAPMLKKGTKLRFSVVYDNSGHAFGNERLSPLPVKFGTGEDDEQMWMHVQLVPLENSQL